jgi:hypothetical protein
VRRRGRGEVRVKERSGSDHDLLATSLMEGLWTGLRNSLRPFRGMNKKYLYQYVAMFEWGDNVKGATLEFLWAFLGVRSATSCPT